MLICLWQQLILEGLFESIEHKFLVSGHTHLPCDRDFAAIEKYLKKYFKCVYTPEDWYTAVKIAKRTNPFEVIIMTQENFYVFKELQEKIVRKTVTDTKEKVRFSKIRCFKFSSENPNIMYIKHLINEDYKPVNIGKKGHRNLASIRNTLKMKYKEPIIMNEKKIDNLRHLIPFIPPVYLQFYKDVGAYQQEDHQNF